MTLTAPPLTQTPLPLPKAAPTAYFEKPGPIAVILGTFFAVTLPMAAVELFSNNHLVTWLYIWLFGITHFIVTLSIYCNSANLKYFASTRKAAFTFFAVPVLIFLTFDLIHAFRLSTTWPVAALVFFSAVRFFDFFHLNRQTFGVLQMFKGRTKAKYSAELRTAENRYLISFVCLLMMTFLSGGVCPLLQNGGPLSMANLHILENATVIADIAILQFVWIAMALTTLILFIKVVRGHLAMGKSNPHATGFGPAVAYVIFQSLGTAMAAIYFPLYLAALAIHYVEYHVLMVPRCFRSPLNPESRLDRNYGWLRQRPVLFYTGILAISAVVAGGAFVGMNAAMGAPIADFSSPISYLMLIAIFDGLFVFHYFVEMYIWKFSDPHFRKMLAGLYFSPAPEAGMIRWILSLTGLALATFAIVALSGPGRIDIDDGQARFEAGRNWVERGRPCVTDSRVYWHVLPGRDGENYTYYRVPPESLAALTVLVADATGVVSEGRRHFVFLLQGAVIAALLVVVLAVAFRREGMSDRAALAWAVGGLFCTPCWYYATSSFDDLLGTFMVIIAITMARRRTAIALLISAIALGLAVNCKPPLAAFLLPCLAVAGPRWWRWLILIAAIPLGWFGQKAYQAWKFPPETTALYEAAMREKSFPTFPGNFYEAMRNIPEAVIDLTIGPSSGTLWYFPPVILAIAGLITVWRSKEKRFAQAVVLASLAFAGFIALLTFYKGGVCWGPRYLTPVFAVLWLVAPWGIERIGRRLTTGLLAAGFVVQLLGLAIVPERLYVEREVPSGFFLVNPWLNLRPEIGHIANRPREIVDSLSSPPSPEYTPSPSPTFTLPVFDPPEYPGPKGIEGVRRYTLLNKLRPWWATFPSLMEDEQPVHIRQTTLLFVGLGLIGLFAMMASSKCVRNTHEGPRTE